MDTLQRIKDELVTASPFVSFLASRESNNSSNTTGPSLVLIFGWRDGKILHVLKYAAGIRDCYPDANIVIFRTTLPYYATSTATREKILMPAVNFVQRTIETAGKNFRGTLVYVLSSGGGFQLMALRKVLQSNRLQFPPAPTALILDSSPGASGLSEAVTSGAPTNILLRTITVPPIALLYAIFFTLNWFRGNPPISYELRTTLNSTSTDTLPSSLLPPLLPGITPLNTRETPRLYIYSHTDKVTPYPRLEEHIAEATQKGFDVYVEVFKNSAHVTHIREDPVKYWAAVCKLWEYANSRANAAL